MTPDEFLLCPTPDAWLETAAENLPVLLIDHANCEKKAAASALNLMFRYVEHTTLIDQLSRLAREELRHFEQVHELMRAQAIVYEALPAGRYAGELRKHLRTHEPARLVDLLIAGAIVEARSCERFGRLAPVLPAAIGGFYTRLMASEARHFHIYLDAARRIEPGIDARVTALLAVDRELIESPDDCFRFHSGVPITPAENG